MTREQAIKLTLMIVIANAFVTTALTTVLMMFIR